jgi:hypothetical protein
MMNQLARNHCRQSARRQQHPKATAAPSLHRCCRSRARAAAAAATTPSTTTLPNTTEHLDLRDPHTGAHLRVFGVDHRYSQPDIAAWILRARPAAVVVETACTPSHGLEAATPLDASSPDQLNAPGASSFFLRMFVQVAAALKAKLLEDGTKNVTELKMSWEEAYESAVAGALGDTSGVWAQASQNFNGEQLAYVAGLAVGASVLFGDRPKEQTYRRLWHGLTAEDLDAAFEDERVRETVGELRAMARAWGEEREGEGEGGPPRPLPASVAEALAAGERLLQEEGSGSGRSNGADRIMLLERDAVMCAVLSLACAQAVQRRQEAAEARENAAAEAAAQSGGGAAASSDDDDSAAPPPPIAIAGVFGAAHLPGIRRLWETGDWRQMLEAGVGDAAPSSAPSPSSSSTTTTDPISALLAASPLLNAPPVYPSGMLSPQAGAKRGLLEALLSNTVTEEVLQDLDSTLPAVPGLPQGLASVEEVLEASYRASHPATAARAWSREIYGTFRMRLAALPVDVLDGVASVWPGAADEGAPLGSELPAEARSAWGLLAPLRALRPTFGGPGWDPAVGVQLRQLNYEFGGSGEEEEEEEDEGGGGSASAASEDSDQTTAAAGGNFFQDQ